MRMYSTATEQAGVLSSVLSPTTKECPGVWKATLSTAAKIKTQGTNIKLAKP